MRAMNLRAWLVAALSLSACASAPHHPSPSPATPAMAATVELAPPRALRAPHPQTIHGHTLTDDYFWLRNKGTPEVENYLRAENAYTQAMTKASEPLRAQLYKEMLARVQETDWRRSRTAKTVGTITSVPSPGSNTPFSVARAPPVPRRPIAPAPRPARQKL